MAYTASEEDKFRCGVFEIPVGGEFIHYYAQSNLVLIAGKLYVPNQLQYYDSAAFIKKAMLAWHCERRDLGLHFDIYCGHTLCQNLRLIAITDHSEHNWGLFKQHHLVEYEFIKTTTTTHRFARFLLKQDQITPRIVRIQRRLKAYLSARRNERLHLLAILSKSNETLNLDVVSVIASML